MEELKERHLHSHASFLTEDKAWCLSSAHTHTCPNPLASYVLSGRIAAFLCVFVFLNALLNTVAVRLPAKCEKQREGRGREAREFRGKEMREAGNLVN